MKIGILTLPLHVNYGGILQAYALQTVLRQKGHETVLIDLPIRKEPVKTRVLTFGKRCVSRYLLFRKKPLRAWPSERERQVIGQHTDRFIRERLSVIDCPDPALLPTLTEREYIGGYVVGSDQVWRPGYTSDPAVYFLTFLEDPSVRRVAYAASFGVDRWEFTPEETSVCASGAALFDALSVREESGIVLCEKYLKCRAVRTLDPTMLLRESDYVRLAEGAPVRKQALCTYVLDQSPVKEAWVSALAARRNQAVRSLSARRTFWDAGSAGLADCVVPPVENWIAGLQEADYVFTDSFHGTVFAILFHKPFISMVNPGRGATRFISLLKTLGLEERMVSEAAAFDPVLADKPIDYDRVDALLEKERSLSFDFLDRALE